jgi:allantoin racemase
VIPVSTKQWNEPTKRNASKHVSSNTKIDVVNLEKAPEAIENHYEVALAAPAAVEAVVEAERKGYDAVVIACFDDPGLHAARERVSIPVVGLGEASMTAALLLGNKFAVISTGRNSGAINERKAMDLGLIKKLAYSGGIDVPVLKLAKDEAKVRQRLLKEAKKAVDEFGAEVIVLGCGGMMGFSEEMCKVLKVPVVDPLLITVKVAETLAILGLKHSKASFYHASSHK